MQRIVYISAVSFVITLVIYLSGILQPFENRAFDQFSRLFNPERPPDDSVVIVSVDQHSLDELSKQGIQWPWPRQLYGPIVEYTSQAKAVFIDILYTEPSSYGKEDDHLFGSAIKMADNVYLSVFLTNQQRGLNEEEMDFLKRHGLSPLLKQWHVPTFHSAILPIEEIRAGIRGIGNVTISPDEDGVYRRIPLLFGLKDMLIGQLVVPYLIQSKVLNIKGDKLAYNERPLPLYSGRALLRYYRNPKPFIEVFAADVLNAYSEAQSGKGPHIEREFFKDKVVFIGLTAAGLYDLKPTATSSVSTGVLIHATLFDNVVRSTLFRPIPSGFTILAIFVLCLLIPSVAMRYHSLTINFLSLCIMLLLTSAATALLFKGGYYGHITSPILAVVVVFLIAVSYSYATEGRERRFIKRAFSQYMDEKVVEYILKHPEVIKPGGQRRRVTVFFADIAGFTTIAERFPSEDTARLLRGVLNVFTETIIRHHGIIDKYIGDCVMAYWGSPYSTHRDEFFACSAALECMEGLKAINRDFAEQGLPNVSMRIGINSGEAIAGNLGSDRLFDYTVIGDTVNVASRLEGVNKRFGTKIIASEETISKTNGAFLTRRLGKVEVKGKTLPIAIYEVIKPMELATTEDIQKRDAFERALALFDTGRIPEAMQSFESLHTQYPEDKTIKVYKEWCEIQTIQNVEG